MGKKCKTRNRYSSEFKANAVKRTLKGDVLIKEVAEELDIPAGYLSAWRRDYLASQESGAVEARLDAIAENKRLKEELKQARMDLEILKKVSSYFASQK